MTLLEVISPGTRCYSWGKCMAPTSQLQTLSDENTPTNIFHAVVWCRESNPVRAPIRATSTEQTHCSTSPPGTSTTSLGAFQFVLQTYDFYKNQTQTQSGLKPTTFTTAHQAPISPSYWIWLILTLSFTFHSFQPQHSKINQESNPPLSVFTAALYLPENLLFRRGFHSLFSS